MPEPNHPERIGRLRVLRQLGRGGMGNVLEAYDEGLARHVAVKALRRSRRWSSTARQRFLREARALSQLEHKNVCRLYDLVRHEGNDYLVMELVDGETLGKIEKTSLSHADKVRIATDIAQALVAAHQRQLIHRDLKPDNVMLTVKKEVKVLDFGLVRSSSPSESGALAFDSHSYLGHSSEGVPETDESSSSNGAPEESPEKAQDPDHHAETGSDQETVTLSRIAQHSPTPVGSSEATSAGSVLGTPAFMSPEQARGKALTTAADVYSFGLLLQFLFSDTPAHPRELPTDKVLERARNNTTATPTKVRGDVRRLIRDLLVETPEQRPSADRALDRLRRIQGRSKRLGLSAAAAVLVLVLGGGAFKYVRDLDRERQQALTARQDSDQVMNYLTNVFFAAAGREKPLKEITALEMLDGGVKRLREELPESPRIRTQILAQIGRVYQALGRYAEAESFLREALETPLVPENEELRIAMRTDLAGNLERIGRISEAEEILNSNLAALQARTENPDETRRMIQENRLQLAGVLQRQERFEESLAMLNQTFGPDSQPGEQWEPTRRLAIALSVAERHDLSRPLFDRAIELAEAAFEPDHENLAMTLESAAIDRMMVRDLDGARALAERALKLNESRQGKNSILWANAAGNLSNLLAQMGNHQDALELAIQARDVFEKMGGAYTVSWSRSLVADPLEKLGRLKEAETEYRRSIEAIYEEDPEHPRVGKVQRYLGRNLMRQERYALAEPELRSALEASQSLHGTDDFRTISRHESLAELYTRWGKPALAAQHHATMMQLLLASPEPARPELRESLEEYAVMLEEFESTELALEARDVLEQIQANETPTSN